MKRSLGLSVRCWVFFLFFFLIYMVSRSSLVAMHSENGFPATYNQLLSQLSILSICIEWVFCEVILSEQKEFAHPPHADNVAKTAAQWGSSVRSHFVPHNCHMVAFSVWILLQPPPKIYWLINFGLRLAREIIKNTLGILFFVCSSFLSRIIELLIRCKCSQKSTQSCPYLWFHPNVKPMSPIFIFYIVLCKTFRNTFTVNPPPPLLGSHSSPPHEKWKSAK